MKYLKTYEEHQLYLPFDYADQRNVFENDRWMVIKPTNYEDLVKLSNGTEWTYQSYKNFNFNSDYFFVNINKINKEKSYFNLYQSHFYDNDDNEIDNLKEFFDINTDLLKFYGEIINCENDSPAIIKDNNEYWMIVDGYTDFVDYFKTDRDVSANFIKDMLEGDSYEYFNYSLSDFKDIENYSIKLNIENLNLLRFILKIEQIYNNDFDYNINEIKDYDDVSNIICKYDIDDLKDIFSNCICMSTEYAEGDKCYEHIKDLIFDFFSLNSKSAKWEYYKGGKYQKLFIKFNNNNAAYNAKLRIKNYDDSYNEDDDSYIKYSVPYYGYSPESKTINYYFNDELSNKIDEYTPENYSKEEFITYLNIWNKLNDEEKKKIDNELMDEIQMRVDAKNFNL